MQPEKLIVMGRSLDSDSAPELAAHYEKHIDGLIIESGFAAKEGLYERLGIAGTIPDHKKEGLNNICKAVVGLTEKI